MEYGTKICIDSLDSNFYAHVGWDQTIENKPCYQSIWDTNRIIQIQGKITELLAGVDPKGRPIIVPIKTIGSVLSEVMNSHRPQVGDIYSRYILPEIEQTRNDVRDIIDRTIQIIVSQVRSEIETIESNNKLSIWSTLYGDFNKEGLRGHAPIKIRKKRVPEMMFQMNY
jgi:hypothetical protein